MTARFAIGDTVTVKAEYPATGHIRTPYYVRGLNGVIADSLGAFGNPESLGAGGDGLPDCEAPGMDEGTVAEIGEDMFGSGERRLPDPCCALTTHLAEGGGLTVH